MWHFEQAQVTACYFMNRGLTCSFWFVLLDFFRGAYGVALRVKFIDVRKTDISR